MEAHGGYRVVALSETDGVDADAVIEFWTREGALSQAAAQQRVREVVLVGLDERGEVAGVATVFLAPCRQLRTEMWHYRLYVGREHRRSTIGLSLVTGAVERLDEAFVSGADRRAPGMLGVVENEGLKNVGRPESEWQQRTGFTFIGVDERGSHLRAHYFPGALAPLPD